jgi:hypothetical protein
VWSLPSPPAPDASVAAVRGLKAIVCTSSVVAVEDRDDAGVARFGQTQTTRSFGWVRGLVVYRLEGE